MTKINRCNRCGSIWLEGDKSSERAFWCKECKRPQDKTPNPNHGACGPFYYGTGIRKDENRLPK